jgi:hypothetical protein
VEVVDLDAVKFVLLDGLIVIAVVVVDLLCVVVVGVSEGLL